MNADRIQTGVRTAAMQFQIRPARKSELKRLARMRADMERLLLKHEPRLWRLSRRQLQTMHRLYAKVMANKMNTMLVAVDAKDQPIGMIMVRTLKAKHMDPALTGRIDDAWVEPRWRRKGVMRQLVRAACDFVERHGARNMMLDYSIRNTVSVKVWTGLGFRPTIMIAFATTKELRNHVSAVARPASARSASTRVADTARER